MATIRRSSRIIEQQSTKSFTTRRLHLREARKSDLADFHEFFSDRDVMRYWSCPTHTSIDRTEWYLNDMIASSTNGESEFVIVLPAAISLDPPSTVVSKDKVIGTVGIWDQTTGEIELMLHRDHWGQGYMKEALATLIPIFWERGVKSLLADVEPRNEDCMNLLNRFGFVETRRQKNTFKTDIGWCDSVYPELWRPRRA